MVAESAEDAALARLRAQLTAGWQSFPALEELDHTLRAAYAEACGAEPRMITVASPTSRLVRRRFARLGEGGDLDAFYHGESAELCIADDGVCYLVYWRKDGGDYAVEWSSATAVPEPVLHGLPDVVLTAMYDGRD
jgi:hypothetical protein